VINLLLVFWLSFSPPSIVIGAEKPSIEKVLEAKKVLEEASRNHELLELNIGEFEIVDPDKSIAALPLLWFESNPDVFQVVQVNKGEVFSIWGKKRGQNDVKLHKFSAKTHSWAIVVGVKNGVSHLVVVTNGKSDTEAPWVIARLEVQVGKSPPLPPPPPAPATPFQKAWDTDKPSCSFDDYKKMVSILKEMANAWPASVKTPVEVVGWISRRRVLAGITDDKLLATRTLIGKELDDKFGSLNPNGVLTETQRREYQSVFSRIVQEMETVRP